MKNDFKSRLSALEKQTDTGDAETYHTLAHLLGFDLAAPTENMNVREYLATVPTECLKAMLELSPEPGTPLVIREIVDADGTHSGERLVRTPAGEILFFSTQPKEATL